MHQKTNTQLISKSQAWYTDLYHHGIEYVYFVTLVATILAGTFMLMKENFGIWECSTEPNTRYYPFSLWYNLNVGAELSHGQSQIRAWYSQGVEKKTQPTTETSGIAGRTFPNRSSSVNYRAWKTCIKIYRWHRYFYYIWDSMIYYVLCRSPFIKSFYHFGGSDICTST